MGVQQINPKSKQFNERVSTLIKNRRRELSMSQDYVAAKMGMAQSTLSRIEKGRLELSLIQWFQIQDILQLSYDEILFDLSITDR